jgi:hypothetical protein
LFLIRSPGKEDGHVVSVNGARLRNRRASAHAAPRDTLLTPLHDFDAAVSRAFRWRDIGADALTLVSGLSRVHNLYNVKIFSKCETSATSKPRKDANEKLPSIPRIISPSCMSKHE